MLKNGHSKIIFTVPIIGLCFFACLSKVRFIVTKFGAIFHVDRIQFVDKSRLVSALKIVNFSHNCALFDSFGI